MIKSLFILTILGALGYGSWWLADSHPEIRDRVIQWLPARSFPALEPRFTAHQIMESQRPKLLKTQQQQFGATALVYHPFLMMKVKFIRSNYTTGEGVMLWDLMDGEMVINTKTWEKSHGFSDCIQMRADVRELKILSLIARHENHVSRDILSRDLNLDGATVDHQLNRLIKKKLIVCHRGVYRIHLEAPNMLFTPTSELTFPLITKNAKHVETLKRNFTAPQITRLAEAAFGDDFGIRQTQEIYIPVYSLIVQNTDGSHQTTYWNALTGNQLS